jgi:hypothetical protein
MASRLGICHVCLRREKLTYEHVPPRRAYNSFPGVAHALSHPLGNDVPIGVLARFRGGMGVRTLCASCNGMTARYYGDAFAEWVRQALVYADRYECVDGRENKILLPFTIEPLAVLKQIATMMLAVSKPSAIDVLYPLRRFVLMPFEGLMTDRISLRVYLNPRRSGWSEPQNRMNGTSVLTNWVKRESTFTIADIAFPPLGYWSAWTDSGRRQLGEFLELADITHFGHYRYGKTTTLWLQMPVKLPVGPVAFHEQYQRT